MTSRRNSSSHWRRSRRAASAASWTSTSRMPERTTAPSSATTRSWRSTGTPAASPGAVGALCEQLLDRAATCELRSIDARLVAEVSGDDAALQPDLGSAPAEESRGSLIDHSNTPLRPEAEPRTAPGPSSVRSEPDPEPDPEPELELELEQGLLPVQQDDNYTDEAGFFVRAGTEPSSRARRKVGPGFTGPVPASRGGARMVRNLIGLAILAVLAAVVHASWSTWNTPAPTSQARGAPPRARMARQPAPIVEPNLPRGATSFAPRPAEQTQALEAAAVEEGLTADLRLRSSSAIGASNGIAPGARRAPGPDPSLSLDELKRIAEQAVPEPNGFEPWTQQGRESAAEPAAAEPPASR